MTPGGFQVDPPRRRSAWWGGALAAAAVLGLVVAVVLLSSARRTQLTEEPIAAPSTTTTLDVPTGSSGAPAGAADGLDNRGCVAIPQAFPLPARGCRIGVPADVVPGEQLPAVILLHGLNNDSEAVAAHGDWRAAAAEHRFVLALPDGQGGSWNAGGCCGLAQKTGIDDVGYLRAVLDQVASLPEVDPDRVAVVGESNGGMMAYTFGCAEASRLMGIVSVEGTPVSSCRPRRPIPVLHIHGTEDEVVPYAGGVSLASLLVGAQFRAVPAAVDDVALAMRCSGDPVESTAGEVTTTDWAGCPEAVRLVTVSGLAHLWPAGERYDGTAEILRFLGLAS